MACGGKFTTCAMMAVLVSIVKTMWEWDARWKMGSELSATIKITGRAGMRVHRRFQAHRSARKATTSAQSNVALYAESLRITEPEQGNHK